MTTRRLSNLPAGQGVGPAAWFRRQAPTVITAATYTLQASDDGKVLVFERELNQEIIVPSNLPAGWQCTIVRGGASSATFRLELAANDSSVILRAQHRVGTSVFAGPPGSIVTIQRLTSNVYAIGGDLYVTTAGSGEVNAALSSKANVGDAQPLVRAGWFFADIAAREAATVAAGDIGYIARVASPLGFWRLVQVSPSVVWEQVGGGGSSGPAPLSLMAGAWAPRVTTGAGIDGFEASTNRQNVDEITFAHTAAEFAQAVFFWPEGASTCTARVSERCTGSIGTVRWRFRARCYTHDQALDQAFGTAQQLDVTRTASGRVLISGATPAITPSGSVSDGALCVLEIERDTSVSGNFSDLARMLGVRLEFQA